MNKKVTKQLEKRVKKIREAQLNCYHIDEAAKKRNIDAFFTLFKYYYTEINLGENSSILRAREKYHEFFTFSGFSKNNSSTSLSTEIKDTKLNTVEEKLKALKIYVVGTAKEYASWTNMTQVDSVEEADLVMFTGGSDVNPSLYAEPVGDYTFIDKARDREEIEIFNKSVKLGKKIIGICRGAQLSCVLSGGKLIQDCTDHNMYTHKITCVWKKNKSVITIPGDHHQMMYPFDMDESEYRILGYSPNKISSHYLNGNNEKIKIPKDFREVEIAIFPKTKALAIQGHPEWDSFDSVANKELRDMLYTFLLIKEFKSQKK